MIYDKLVTIMSDRLSVSPQEITPDTLFKDDLAVDSLDLYDLVMALEEEFGVEIPDEDAENIKTIGDALEYIKKITNEQ